MKILQKISNKLFSIIILFMLFNSEVNAQTKPMRVSIKVNLKVDTTKVRLYDKIEIEENENIKTIVLKMRYGSSEILNPKAAKVLEKGGCKVLSVDIVYTDYNNNDVQNTLNKKRLMELYFLSPDIFNQKLVKWKYIEQLGYSTEEVARGLFHGIVIKYVKVPVYKPTSLEEMFGNLKVEKLGDTSLFKLFEKHVKFDEELICADLTGSMSPYYFQVFAWLNLKHNPKKLNYSFFNDGDNTPDYLKKRGRVGGIYLCKTSSVDTMTSLAYNCIVNGNGGDSPENNIESILKGVKEYPETKEIIMLADNWANMRDYSLISRVKIPVKVIVCGTNLYGIKTPVNSEYLDLARRTGGSVHTIEEDILDLAKKKEGDVITVGGVKYQIRGGRFIKR